MASSLDLMLAPSPIEMLTLNLISLAPSPAKSSCAFFNEASNSERFNFNPTSKEPKLAMPNLYTNISIID